MGLENVIKQIENAVRTLIKFTDEDKITWKYESGTGYFYWWDSANTTVVDELTNPHLISVQMVGGWDMPVSLNLRRKLLSAINILDP